MFKVKRGPESSALVQPCPHGGHRPAAGRVAGAQVLAVSSAPAPGVAAPACGPALVSGDGLIRKREEGGPAGALSVMCDQAGGPGVVAPLLQPCAVRPGPGPPLVPRAPGPSQHL